MTTAKAIEELERLLGQPFSVRRTQVDACAWMIQYGAIVLAALKAQGESKPKAWWKMFPFGDDYATCSERERDEWIANGDEVHPLYATPPAPKGEGNV